MRTAAIALALMATTVAAQAEGYAGFSGGITSANIDCAGTSSCDNSGTGGKVFGGFRLATGLGFEAFYASFGDAKATVPTGFGPVNAKISSRSMGVALSFEAPLTPSLAVGSRLGIASNRSKISASGAAAGSEDESSTSSFFGLQLSWKVSPTVSLDLTADFSRFELFGDSYNTRLFGGGFTFRF